MSDEFVDCKGYNTVAPKILRSKSPTVLRRYPMTHLLFPNTHTMKMIRNSSVSCLLLPTLTTLLPRVLLHVSLSHRGPSGGLVPDPAPMTQIRPRAGCIQTRELPDRPVLPQVQRKRRKMSSPSL